MTDMQGTELSDDSPKPRVKRRTYTLLIILVSLSMIPVIVFVSINAATIHARRQMFLEICTREAGIYVLNERRDWERILAPDCSNARDRWICSISYNEAELQSELEIIPFSFSGRDEFGYINLAPVPRISYWRRPDGELVRISNFAFLNLQQWDWWTLSYPMQHLCFAPLTISQ